MNSSICRVCLGRGRRGQAGCPDLTAIRRFGPGSHQHRAREAPMLGTGDWMRQARHPAPHPCATLKAAGCPPDIRHGKDQTARRTGSLTRPAPNPGGRDPGNKTQRPPSDSSRHPGAPGPAPWMGWRRLEISPLLVQWACSPLQVRCKPGAGGNRPEGSSKMQDWAQPPAGRWDRGGAAGTVLLVGTRGTEKGSGYQQAEPGTQRREGEGEAPGSSSFHLHLRL